MAWGDFPPQATVFGVSGGDDEHPYVHVAWILGLKCQDSIGDAPAFDSRPLLWGAATEAFRLDKQDERFVHELLEERSADGDYDASDLATAVGRALVAREYDRNVDYQGRQLRSWEERIRGAVLIRSAWSILRAALAEGAVCAFALVMLHTLSTSPHPIVTAVLGAGIMAAGIGTAAFPVLVLRGRRLLAYQE
jgi:hypothetical protein